MGEGRSTATAVAPARRVVCRERASWPVAAPFPISCTLRQRTCSNRCPQEQGRVSGILLNFGASFFSLEALRRGKNNDGGKWRILLEAFSHESPRKRLGCDGRFDVDLEGRFPVYPALVTKQPTTGQHCFPRKRRGREKDS